jgi:hypothetical protein
MQLLGATRELKASGRETEPKVSGKEAGKRLNT